MANAKEKIRLKQMELFQDTVVWAPLNSTEMWPAKLLPRLPGTIPGVRPDRMLRCVEFFGLPSSHDKHEHQLFHIRHLYEYVSRRERDSTACKEAEDYILKFGTDEQREGLRSRIDGTAPGVKLLLNLKLKPVHLKLFLKKPGKNGNAENGETSFPMKTAGVLGRRKRGRSRSSSLHFSNSTPLKLWTPLENNKDDEGINTKKLKIQVDPSDFTHHTR